MWGQMKRPGLRSAALTAPAPALAVILALAIFGVSRAAVATPCHATPTCTAGGATFTLTDPGDGAGAVETDDSGLKFLATFNPSNENPSTITTAVDAFLAAEGLPGGQYFGRTGGTGTGSGGSVSGASFSTTSTNGGLAGTWALNPGSTGTTPGYISLHAGGGQHDVLLEIISGLDTGPWDTSENINGGGNSAAISNFDLFSGGSPTSVPEPTSLLLLGTAIAALHLLRRRSQRIV